MNSFRVRAPCFAAAPASSATVCRATAPAPPAAAAVAKDGESTGALCPAHNLSSSLPVCPSLLDSRSAQSAAAGAEADSQYESGGSDASHPLLQAWAPALLSSSAVGCPALLHRRWVAVYLHESQCGCMWPTLLQMLMKLLVAPLRCCKLSLSHSLCVWACQCLSCSLPFTSSPVLLQWFCLSISVSTHPSFSSSSVTPLIFFLSYPLQSIHLLNASLQRSALGNACAIWTQLFFFPM